MKRKHPDWTEHEWQLVFQLASEEHWHYATDFQEHLGQRKPFSISEFLKEREGEKGEASS